MSIIATNLSRLMAREGINTIELAREIGVPQPTLHKILTGKSKQPRRATLRTLAHYFKVDVSDITTESANDKNATYFHLAPLLNWSNITSWINNDKSLAKNAENIPVRNTASNATFATIPNDYVIPQYKNGSILVFDPELPPKDGSLVLVELAEHQEILLRQLALDVGKKYIQSLNPSLGSRLSELGKKDRILATLIQIIVNYE